MNRKLFKLFFRFGIIILVIAIGVFALFWITSERASGQVVIYKTSYYDIPFEKFKAILSKEPVKSKLQFSPQYNTGSRVTHIPSEFVNPESCTLGVLDYAVGKNPTGGTEVLIGRFELLTNCKFKKDGAKEYLFLKMKKVFDDLANSIK